MGVLLQGFYLPGSFFRRALAARWRRFGPFFGGTTLRRKRRLWLKRDSRPSGCRRPSKALGAPFRVVRSFLTITISVPKTKEARLPPNTAPANDGNAVRPCRAPTILMFMWDSVRAGVHFTFSKSCTPVVADGKRFVPTYDGRVDLYMLKA